MIDRFAYVKKSLLAVITVVAAGAGLLYVGYVFGSENPHTIRVEGITNILDEEVTADFNPFWEVWRLIKDEHIDGENVSDQDLVYGSISGLVGALDDPNSAFFPPADAKKFEEDLSGSFGGIGAEIGSRNGQLIVVAPLKSTPAERAGLKAGDQILRVDETSAAGLSVDEAVKIIRGAAGSVVTLLILREDWSAPREILITRELIKVSTLDFEMIDGRFAHIKLHAFNRNAPYEFYQALLKSLLGGAEGIILDLRNNPGGFLEVAVHIAGWFIDPGQVVVTEEFRSGEKRLFRSDGTPGALKNFPVVILVNKGSASASEILAGALRDHRGAKLVGERTFGKGTVQELKYLSDESTVKITTARWLLPSGKVIDKEGLTPDIEVPLTEEDFNAKRDPQLDSAIEVLKSELGK